MAASRQQAERHACTNNVVIQLLAELHSLGSNFRIPSGKCVTSHHRRNRGMERQALTNPVSLHRGNL